MNRNDITTLVTASALRFGFRNPQQLEQLEARLRKAEQSEVLCGLMAVFSQGEPAPISSAAQELAGRLLVSLKPVGSIDLKTTLQSALPRYELSVQEFPGYLAALYGPDAVQLVLQDLSQEGLNEHELKALETMLFWLRNLQYTQLQNGA